MIEADLFIGTIVVALVQALKEVFPQISGVLTTLAAMIVGALIAAFAPHVGVAPVSVAMGVLDGLAAVGVHTIASAPKPKV